MNPEKFEKKFESEKEINEFAKFLKDKFLK